MTPQLPAANIAEYIVQHPKEANVIFCGCITVGVAIAIVGAGGLIAVKLVSQ